MKKLQLDQKDLRIESFKPAVHTGKRADVIAQATCIPTDTEPTCDHTNFNGYTCSVCFTSCEAIC